MTKLHQFCNFIGPGSAYIHVVILQQAQNCRGNLDEQGAELGWSKRGINSRKLCHFCDRIGADRVHISVFYY
jgi:hypothetical protein